MTHFQYIPLPEVAYPSPRALVDASSRAQGAQLVVQRFPGHPSLVLEELDAARGVVSERKQADCSSDGGSAVVDEVEVALPERQQAAEFAAGAWENPDVDYSGRW